MIHRASFAESATAPPHFPYKPFCVSAQLFWPTGPLKQSVRQTYYTDANTHSRFSNTKRGKIAVDI